MSDTDPDTPNKPDDPNDQNTQEGRRSALISSSSEPLNDYSHRRGASPSPQSPSDLVTEPTSAQRERVVYLVDDALDTIETIMNGGKEENRLRAAENVLDRAGLSKQKDRPAGDSTVDIPADALVQVIRGLAHVFGASPDGLKDSEEMADRTPPVNVAAKDVAKHAHPAKEAVTVPQQAPPEPSEASLRRGNFNEDGTEELRGPEDRSVSRKSGLPPSLLRQYGGTQ